MPTLRVHVRVPSYEKWKTAFDNDPVHRRDGGVRRYRVERPVSDPHFAMVDLEFDTVERAEGFLQRLRHLWSGPGGQVIQNPEAWVLETVEVVELEPVPS